MPRACSIRAGRSTSGACSSPAAICTRPICSTGSGSCEPSRAKSASPLVGDLPDAAALVVAHVQRAVGSLREAARLVQRALGIEHAAREAVGEDLVVAEGQTVFERN